MQGRYLRYRKERSIMYKDILAKVTNKETLTPEEISEFIGAVAADEVTPVQIAGFQVGLLMKGTSIEELAAFANAMRANCVPIKACEKHLIHLTLRRSISSLSGSADVLEALGVNINLDKDQAAQLIEKIGIAFIYAPLFHPVMGKVLPPESELGIKTIFYTIIGPLINPAFAPRHLLGVYKPELLETVSEVARRIGYTKAMFVYGEDGLDEISLLGKTKIYELKDGEILKYTIAPEDFGLKSCTLEDIKTGTPEENAATIKGVFNGEITGPKKDAIILNASGALVVGGKAENFEEGIPLAREIIESGAALKKLNELVEESNNFAK